LAQPYLTELLLLQTSTGLWELWLAWKKQRKKELGVVRSSHAMEEP